MLTRRQFAAIGLGAIPLTRMLPLAARPLLAAPATTRISSKIRGVEIGLESYSLSTLPHDGILDATMQTMVDIGLGECAIYEPLMLPPDVTEQIRQARAAAGPPGSAMSPAAMAQRQAANDAQKQWRMNVSLDYFTGIRRKFDAAGIDLYAYTPAVPTAMTSDEELERTCAITKALGARLITSALPLSVAKRFAPLAEKHDLQVGLQGRLSSASANPDTISTMESYVEAISYSKNYWMQPDTGDTLRGGVDPLKLIQDHHARIIGINLKDRKKTGEAMPYGEGDTPIKQILLLIRDNKYPIFVNIDCDYKTAPDSTRVADVKQCFRYIKETLEA